MVGKCKEVFHMQVAVSLCCQFLFFVYGVVVVSGYQWQLCVFLHIRCSFYFGRPAVGGLLPSEKNKGPASHCGGRAYFPS